MFFTLKPMMDLFWRVVVSLLIKSKIIMIAQSAHEQQIAKMTRERKICLKHSSNKE